MSNLSSLQVTTNNLLNWVFQDKDGVIKDKPDFVFDMFADHLETTYEAWDIADPTRVIELCELDQKDYSNPDIDFILEIQDEIAKSEIFASFLVHGSCADLRMIPGWSDFDSIGILKHESLSRSSRAKTFNTCQKIDHMMRSLDPYQHHGIHFIHEKELRSFPDLYLPVELLRDSKCLLGNKSIGIEKSDSRSQEIARFLGIVKTLSSAATDGILKHHAKNGKYLLEDYKDPETMYQLKYLMCVVMLLPTLWLNLRGNYCRKPESYEMIRRHFTDEELEFLDVCSTVRKKWKKSYHQGNFIPDEVRDILGLDYLKRAARFAKILEINLES